MTTTARIALPALAAMLLGLLLTPVAAAAPPQDILEQARAGVARGRAAVNEAHADGEKAVGLERAAAAIEAAAQRKADRAGDEFPGNGRALGRGRSAAVHAYLADGLSPSDLPSHGEAVSALARALERLRTDHPGRGHGLDKEKPARAGDDESATDGA